jgi:hypothetical protein
LAGISGLLLGLILFCITPVSIPTADGFRTPAGTTPPVASPAIFAGLTLMQQFPAAGGTIQSIALQLATYKRVNAGEITVTIRALRDGQWVQLGEQTIAKASLRDNAYQAFRFSPPIATNAGELLSITIRADGDAQQSISWWLNPTLQLPQYQFYANGGPQQGTAFYSISYVPRSGPLVTLLAPIWSRLTIFLDPIWQAVLLGGVGLVIAAPLLALSWRGGGTA